ncbi:hypothetical protein [Pseudarthrobacter sp. NS4]|uniref:hypothetical protein n=1 Tax=Pseudarthrobacter sp. NS4 TaxID=2973976 RepID=UPI00216315AC|nr:hypothetical protein [Pseudarthrobacter sp. NS4]
MKDFAALAAKLTPEEKAEIRSSAPDGILSEASLTALDRAAGGSAMGHGYYVSSGTTDANGSPEFVLHHEMAREIFGSTG